MEISHHVENFLNLTMPHDVGRSEVKKKLNFSKFPVTRKIFSAVCTHMINICVKCHWNSSPNTDIAMVGDRGTKEQCKIYTTAL